MRRLPMITLLTVLVSTACSSAAEQDATRDDAGDITESEDIGVFRLQEGDCLMLPDGGVGGEVVETMAAVPCSEPHSGEVLAVVVVDGDDGAEFPGAAAVDDVAMTECLGAFERVTGNDFMTDPDWDMTSLNPSADSWNLADDREIVCIVTPLDGSLTTQTVVG